MKSHIKTVGIITLIDLATPAQKIVAMAPIHPLHEAAMGARADEVDRLINVEGVDVNIRGPLGMTPLGYLVRAAHELYSWAGAEPKQEWRTPQLDYGQRDVDKTLQILCQAGAHNVGSSPLTPLLEADPEMVKKVEARWSELGL